VQITKRELERYRRQVKSRQDDAYAYVSARIRSEAAGMTVADARDASIAIVEDCLAVFGDQAQALSAELFDEICDAEGIGAAPGAMFDDVIDRSMLADKVHYFAGKLVGGDWEGYAGSNADLAACYVHRSALENMARNCYANGVKYARVPTGRETCAWCYMLASRDFDYVSDRSAAAASHAGCDCVIVPGVKGVTHIDGYDPDGIGKRMGVIEKQTGLRFGSDRKQMDKLTQIMRLRDKNWLYRGMLPSIDYSVNPRNAYGLLKHDTDKFSVSNYREENFSVKGTEWRDLFVHDVMRNSGFPLKTFGPTDIDLTINGIPFEVKSPHNGASKRFVESNVRRAKKQFSSRGIGKPNIVFSTLYRSEPDDWIIEEIKRQKELHAPVGHMIIVNKNGEIIEL
jgi:hypothetical protein